MQDAGPSVDDATRAQIDRVFREEFGRVVSVLIRLVGDFELAEDLVGEAFARALEEWPQKGVPERPGAWLTTVARRRGLDRLRHQKMARTKHAELRESDSTSSERLDEQVGYPDERLRLIFTCCHPALSPEAQVALTLRTLGGLETGEIARAFLLPESTLAQRLVRAKKKIRLAKIPYEVPAPSHQRERLDAVLRVVYLIFNEGYQASAGELMRADLCEEAIRLGELLVELLPDEPEARGLCALMFFHHSRRAARLDDAGDLVVLEDQDRSRWDQLAIARGRAHLEAAMASSRGGPYQVQAAIAALHAQAPDADSTDWPQILMLYQGLLRWHESPVVRLNAVVALAMVEGPERGLEAIARLEEKGQLDGYHLLWAAKADLLRRAGRQGEAVEAYREALRRVGNDAERRFLQSRLDGCARAE